MILHVSRDPSKGWSGTIEHDGEVVVRSRTPEPRLGCAIRSLMNSLQQKWGQPDIDELYINLENW